MKAAREPLAEMMLRRLTRDIDQNAFVLRADGHDRPDVIIVDQRYGLVAVDIDVDGTDPTAREPFARLNRKIAELRRSTPVVERFRPHRLVLFGGYDGKLISRSGALRPNALSLVDLEGRGWLSWLEQRPPDIHDFDALRSALVPALVFDIHARRGASDPGLSARGQLRTTLDAQQARAATGVVEDVLMISGPPGSGKTLVLAGRARFLATEHPDWRIAVLCYNNALVPYLRQLVAGHTNIEVDTFGKFAYKLGHRISLDSEEQAKRDLERASAKGIACAVDALLVDEAQDFFPAWLQFALATVQAGRGGAVLVGDDEQALYRDAVEYSALADRRVQRLRLTHSYRSTRQILKATAATHPQTDVAEDGSAPEGESVDLIWAPTWTDQAAATAWEVRRMLDLGERGPQDIGILVTQKAGTLGRLRAALDGVDVPHVVIGRDNASAFDPRSPEVKVMTVHSAKGHEFGVVVLFGLEALPDPAGPDTEAARRGRVGFVGMTRARDQLLVTYTRGNPYLDRLRGCDDVRTWTWPDDYEV